MHVDAAVGVAEADFDSARIIEAAAVEAEVVFEGLEDELALVERGFWFARHGCRSVCVDRLQCVLDLRVRGRAVGKGCVGRDEVGLIVK